jgi:hypothetical protein
MERDVLTKWEHLMDRQSAPRTPEFVGRMSLAADSPSRSLMPPPGGWRVTLR